MKLFLQGLITQIRYPNKTILILLVLVSLLLFRFGVLPKVMIGAILFGIFWIFYAVFTPKLTTTKIKSALVSPISSTQIILDDGRKIPLQPFLPLLRLIWIPIRYSILLSFCVFNILLMAGLGTMLYAFYIKHQYVASQCLIVDKKLEETISDGTTQYRPSFLLHYSINNVFWQTWALQDVWGDYSSNKSMSLRLLDSFQLQQNYPCWYDPMKPSNVILTVENHPSSRWMIITGLLATIFFGFCRYLVLKIKF